MKYEAKVIINIKGNHTLDEVKEFLQEDVTLDFDNESGSGQIKAICIDWETLKPQ